MELKAIIEIIAATIISVGGAGVIILKVANFLAEKVAERLNAKYQLKLDEELEKYKSKLERKTYVSQVRFDKEFSIYTDLSEKTISAVFSTANIVVLFHNGLSPADFEEQKKEIIEKFNAANKTLNQYAPFIDEELYEQYSKIYSKFISLLNLYTYWERTVNNCGRDYTTAIAILTPYIDTVLGNAEKEPESYTLRQLEETIIRTRNDISNESDEIIKKVRTYLNSLDVI